MRIKVPDGRGFDVVVWQKPPAGTVFCAAYTRAGAIYLVEWLEIPVGIRTAYDMGGIHPRDFLKTVPSGLKIGGVGPESGSVRLINPPLH
jgi:hypothetical protein